MSIGGPSYLVLTPEQFQLPSNRLFQLPEALKQGSIARLTQCLLKLNEDQFINNESKSKKARRRAGCGFVPIYVSEAPADAQAASSISPSIGTTIIAPSAAGRTHTAKKAPSGEAGCCDAHRPRSRTEKSVRQPAAHRTGRSVTIQWPAADMTALHDVL